MFANFFYIFSESDRSGHGNCRRGEHWPHVKRIGSVIRIVAEPQVDKPTHMKQRPEWNWIQEEKRILLIDIA